MFPTLFDIPEALRSAGAAAPLVSIGLMVLHTVVPFPSGILTITNGIVFGPVLGLAVSWIGGMLGAYLGYGIARLGGRPLVRRFVRLQRLERLDRLVGAGGTWGLVTVRLLPVVSFNLINYGAGLLSIKLWTFTWTTAIGIVPVTAAMVWVGGAILKGGLLLWWTVGLLTIAVAVGALVRLTRKRTRQIEDRHDR